MCLWTLNQDRSFFEKNKSPIIDILTKELEITPDQIDKILERRYAHIKFVLMIVYLFL
jgi:hypothetical protein